jgi:hypothetical protein
MISFCLLMIVPETPHIDQRAVALSLVCLLSSMILLDSGSAAPGVTISQVPQLEDGMKVRLSGLLVDEWQFESGSESLVLAEPSGGSSVKVISSPGMRPQPSQYAELGDELQVTGELSKSGLVPTIFAKSDDISVSRESEQVLTVDILIGCWRLFEGDCVRIKGLLDFDGLGIAPRLFGFGMNCSLALDIGGLDVDAIMGHRVVVTGILHFEFRTSALVILVRSIMADE